MNEFHWIWMETRKRRLYNHRKCQLQIPGGSLRFPVGSVLPSCRIYLFDSGGLKRAGENARQLTWRNKGAREKWQQEKTGTKRALNQIVPQNYNSSNLPPTGRADLDVGEQNKGQQCHAPRGRLHLMALHVDILRKKHDSSNNRE